MKIPRALLLVALVVILLVVLGCVSFFTAMNWVFLTTNDSVVTRAATSPASVMSKEAEGILCELKNYSIRPIYYGAHFSIETWVHDRWEELPVPEDLKFHLGIAVVNPFSSVELLYPAGLFTHKAGEGLYRIKQNIWVGESQNPEKHALYCEFTVIAES